MENKAKLYVSVEEKDKYINALTDELPTLRAKANISQDELAKFIGISRQNYGWIERKSRKMSWNTYLSLVFYFDNNQATHTMLRALSAFPTELIDRINGCTDLSNFEKIIGISMESLENTLDEQALYAIRALIMVEYARCSNLPADAVIRSFDGKAFATKSKIGDIAVKRALRNIKGSGDSKR